MFLFVNFLVLVNTWKVNWWIVWWRRWIVRGWTAWRRWLLFSLFLIHLFELSGNHTHLLNGLVIHVIPPFILPVGWFVLALDAESKSVVSSPDLHAFGDALLFSAETVALFPAHVGHKFFGVFAFELSVGNTCWLEKFLSVLGWHAINQQNKKWL